MKSKNLWLSVLAVSTLFLGNLGFSPAAGDPRMEAEKAIAKSNSIYFSSYVKNDPAIFADRYSYVNGPRNGRFTTAAICGDGMEYVTEQGETKIMDEKGNVTDEGKYLVLWKRTPAGWKMFRDCFSNYRPGK